MELDDSIRQSTSDLGHSLSDLVPPTLINLVHTWESGAARGGAAGCQICLLLNWCSSYTTMHTGEKEGNPVEHQVQMHIWTVHRITGFIGDIVNHIFAVADQGKAPDRLRWCQQTHFPPTELSLKNKHPGKQWPLCCRHCLQWGYIKWFLPYVCAAAVI